MDFSQIKVPENDSLEKIREDIKNSPLAKMYPGVTQTVPGDGPASAEIMFIGEAPGADEDKQGKPFVGRAGKLLTELLEGAGIQRSDVYISNIVKVRPPGNRDPEPHEKDKWFPFLIREIHVIKPLIIATLGRHSMGHFLEGQKISQIHGEAKSRSGIWHEKQIFMPLYHPAVALYSGSKKETLLEDMVKLTVLIKKIKNENFYQ